MKTTEMFGKKNVQQSNIQEQFNIKEVLCLPINDVFIKLGSSELGLTSEEVRKRLETYGYNELAKKERKVGVVRFLSRLKDPLVIILLFAGLIAGFLGELTDTAIIFSIVMISVVLTFLQESRAEKAAADLRERVATTATVLREGGKQEIRLSELVPGDVVGLSAGDIVPADMRLITAKDFFVDQSALTGESFPAEKNVAPLKAEETSTISEWNNFLLFGTSVTSGTASAVVVRTGNSTEYGKIVKSIVGKRPETEFEKGLKKFGLLIMQVTFLLVMFVFFILTLLRHDVLESLLFSVALAVGLTPELLPMILTVNLSKGGISMAKKGVIVKRLSSIQNFGNMDVLCTDKTGTLTENKVSLVMHVDFEGTNDEKVLLYSFLNSYYQAGLKSPLDNAILEHEEIYVKGYEKVDEVPFDFTRRRVSVVVEFEKERFIITKGAPEEIIKVCSHYELPGNILDLEVSINHKIEKLYSDLSSEGFRLLGVSYKRVSAKSQYSIDDENDMIFLGYVAFMDPPKESAKESIESLRKAGIELKILTGDNELVTRKVCQQIGFEIKEVVLGSDIAQMNDDALARVVEEANIFTRVTPAQKNRILHALKNNGHVAGFLGDGINDTPSMKVADVSISVNNAVDVAKESADIILLHKDLTVLQQGVLEGRKTFGNTMKYVLMSISSNFGNMFSAAGASLFLPFLPMLPIQILLNNLLYDISEMAIPTDNVDQTYTERPKRMDAAYIRNFMIFFGPISSLFDFLTFFIMIAVFNATEPLFQTAWFLESLCTQTLVIFVIRTRRRPFYKSKPSKPLILSSLGIVGVALILPFTIFRVWFKFTIPPLMLFLFLAAFIAIYLLLVEVLKTWFYNHYAKNLERYA